MRLQPGRHIPNNSQTLVTDGVLITVIVFHFPGHGTFRLLFRFIEIFPLQEKPVPEKSEIQYAMIRQFISAGIVVTSMGCSRSSLVLLLIVFLTSGCISSSPAPSDIRVPDASPVTVPGLSPDTGGHEAIPTGYAGIQFRGDVDLNCSRLTVHALELLDRRDREDFLTVTSYIGIIECRDDWSGMYAWENPPRFAVGRATRESGTIWYAGAIAHDSCHSRQYRKFTVLHPGAAVPLEIFSGETAEMECIRYQYGVLQKIGAPEKMLEYVANVSSTRYWENRTGWW
jgi:hypothetical protein